MEALVAVTGPLLTLWMNKLEATMCARQNHAPKNLRGGT
jgi:hypothetical protein